MQGDRFIPDRSVDMDLAHYLLTESKEGQGEHAGHGGFSHHGGLPEKLLNNRTRIIAFRNKPLEPENVFCC
jgi:cell division cycle protein 20 (cofactor of APC complex)